jgi:transposase
MILLHSQTPILVGTKPVDFRKGIDGFVALVRDTLAQQPNNGHYFVFSNRNHSRIKILTYDGTGYWLMTKRLSKGRFLNWPQANEPLSTMLAVHLLALLHGQTDHSQYLKTA